MVSFPSVGQDRNDTDSITRNDISVANERESVAKRFACGISSVDFWENLGLRCDNHDCGRKRGGMLQGCSSREPLGSVVSSAASEETESTAELDIKKRFRRYFESHRCNDEGDSSTIPRDDTLSAFESLPGSLESVVSSKVSQHDYGLDPSGSSIDVSEKIAVSNTISGDDASLSRILDGDSTGLLNAMSDVSKKSGSTEISDGSAGSRSTPISTKEVEEKATNEKITNKESLVTIKGAVMKHLENMFINVPDKNNNIETLRETFSASAMSSASNKVIQHLEEIFSGDKNDNIEIRRQSQSESEISVGKTKEDVTETSEETSEETGEEPVQETIEEPVQETVVESNSVKVAFMKHIEDIFASPKAENDTVGHVENVENALEKDASSVGKKSIESVVSSEHQSKHEETPTEIKQSESNGNVFTDNAKSSVQPNWLNIKPSSSNSSEMNNSQRGEQIAIQQETSDLGLRPDVCEEDNSKAKQETLNPASDGPVVSSVVNKLLLLPSEFQTRNCRLASVDTLSLSVSKESCNSMVCDGEIVHEQSYDDDYDLVPTRKPSKNWKVMNIVKKLGNKNTKSKSHTESSQKLENDSPKTVPSKAISSKSKSTVDLTKSVASKCNRELLMKLQATTDFLPDTPHTQECQGSKESPVMSEVTCSVFGNQSSNMLSSRGNASSSSSNKMNVSGNDSSSNGKKSTSCGNISSSNGNKKIDPSLALVPGKSDESNTVSSQNLNVDGSHLSVINIVEGDESDAVELLRQQVPRQVSEKEVVVRTEEIPLPRKASIKTRKKIGRMFRR